MTKNFESSYLVKKPANLFLSDSYIPVLHVSVTTGNQTNIPGTVLLLTCSLDATVEITPLSAVSFFHLRI